ncbi:diphthine synthase [Candidatus Micrarchaeota archaeon]|nr:diphthine synthase [Candidatus Micrarchaeota archaeon]
MSLTFVGTGVWSAKDISVRGLEALKQCDVAFAENYTSRLDVSLFSELEQLSGKKITMLSREQVEGEKQILESAKTFNTVLLISGDPMISTTHVSLQFSAEKQGIQTNIIHASSILTALIGETGLHVYKFGRPCTLAFWTENYKPTSTYKFILENNSRSLHSIIFLDLKQACMGALDAIKLLLEIEKIEGKKLFTEKTKLVVASRIGSGEQKITFAEIGKLLSSPLGKPPFIIILPGKLHFTEEEALVRFHAGI